MSGVNGQAREPSVRQRRGVTAENAGQAILTLLALLERDLGEMGEKH